MVKNTTFLEVSLNKKPPRAPYGPRGGFILSRDLLFHRNPEKTLLTGFQHKLTLFQA